MAKGNLDKPKAKMDQIWVYWPFDEKTCNETIKSSRLLHCNFEIREDADIPMLLGSSDFRRDFFAYFALSISN